MLPEVSALFGGLTCRCVLNITKTVVFIHLIQEGCFGNLSWAYGTHFNDLLECPPNNNFPWPNSPMPEATFIVSGIHNSYFVCICSQH